WSSRASRERLRWLGVRAGLCRLLWRRDYGPFIGQGRRGSLAGPSRPTCLAGAVRAVLRVVLRRIAAVCHTRLDPCGDNAEHGAIGGLDDPLQPPDLLATRAVHTCDQDNSGHAPHQRNRVADRQCRWSVDDHEAWVGLELVEHALHLL